MDLIDSRHIKSATLHNPRHFSTYLYTTPFIFIYALLFGHYLQSEDVYVETYILILIVIAVIHAITFFSTFWNVSLRAFMCLSKVRKFSFSFSFSFLFIFSMI